MIFMILKRELGRNLDEARRRGSHDLPERRTGDVSVNLARTVELWGVKTAAEARDTGERPSRRT
jgi:hypothetical protein